MADKITTLKEEITGNDVYPNVKDENIPDTIQRKLTSGDGITIEDNKVSLGTIQDKSIPDSTNKEVAFNNGVKTNKVTDLNGYKVVEDDNSHINIGNTSRLLQMYGSGSRPTYGGKDLAFYTDTQENNWGLLWANLGVGRFENTKIPDYPWETAVFKDTLSTKYTKLTKYLNGAEGVHEQTGVYQLLNSIIMPDFNTDNINGVNCTWMFNDFSGFRKIILGNLYIATDSHNVFSHIKDLEEIAIADGKKVKLNGYAPNTFYDCPELTTIGTIDMSDMNLDGAQYSIHMFMLCPKLKTINCTHWKTSFNITCSTAFEQSDLVNIISNLDAVSNGAVLTMGTTNLNKLTTDQIAVATGKGWTLA